MGFHLFVLFVYFLSSKDESVLTAAFGIMPDVVRFSSWYCKGASPVERNKKSARTIIKNLHWMEGRKEGDKLESYMAKIKCGNT